MLKLLSSRFFRHQRGVALIEFALVAPVLILLLLGAIELTRYISIVQKLDKASYAMADLTNQYPPATEKREMGELDRTQLLQVVFPQYKRLMSPYMDDPANGSVILSSIRKEGNQLALKWRDSSLGAGGNLSNGVVSAINGSPITEVTPITTQTFVTGGTIMAQADRMADGENMIVSEVFYRYQPILRPVLLELGVNIGEATLARRVYTRPRLGDLACLPTASIYPDCQPTTGSSGASCRDECGNVRSHNSRWCKARVTGPITPTMQCVNGLVYNLGTNFSIGCDRIRSPSC